MRIFGRRRQASFYQGAGQPIPTGRQGLFEKCGSCNGRYPVPAYMHHNLDECLANIADHRRIL